MKNKILPTCLQGNYGDSLGEFNNMPYGKFGAEREGRGNFLLVSLLVPFIKLQHTDFITPGFGVVQGIDCPMFRMDHVHRPSSILVTSMENYQTPPPEMILMLTKIIQIS